MTALVLASAWTLGITAGLLWASDPWWAWAAGGAAALAAAWLAGPTRARWMALVLAALLFGVSRTVLGTAAAPRDPLAELTGPVTLLGRVAEVPVPQAGRVAFPLEVVGVERPQPGRSVDSAARVLVRATGDEVEYGDLVEAHGQLSEPRSRPGYPAAELLSRRGITHVLDWATVRVHARAQPDLLGALYALRRRLESSLRAALPEPHASLTAGILLGTRSGSPPELRSALAATSTSHIVAVSGFNVAVMAGIVQLVALRLVGRPWALLPMLVTVWGYTLLTGAPPSAVRAGAMVSFVLGANAVGRLADPITTLGLVAAAMLAWDPVLLLDLGFQLSVAATAGLILFARPIAERLLALPRLVRESLGVAIAAHLATLPIILGTFHTLSVIGPLANLLIEPVVPWIMLVGGLLAVFGFAPGLGDLLTWCTWLLVSYILAAINWSAGLPGSVLFTGRLPVWAVAGWYGLLAVWAAAGSADVRAVGGKPPAPRAGLLAALLALLPASAVLAAPPTSGLAVSFLDVGAPSLFVRTPDGRTALVGGGGLSDSLVASVGERLALWERGLDLAVLNTTNAPHPSGLTETLRRYPARLVLGPPSDGAESMGAGAMVLAEAGQRVEVDTGLWLDVVDVRTYQEQTVLDVELVMGDVAVWLPGPGPPSYRWQDPDRDGRTVVIRLPSRPTGWLQNAPRAPRLAVISDGPLRRASGRSGDAPTLDHRTYGDVLLFFDGAQPSLRTERCAAGRACLVALALEPEPETDLVPTAP